MTGDYALIERYLQEVNFRDSTVHSARSRLRNLADHLVQQRTGILYANRDHLKAWRISIRRRLDGDPRSASSQQAMIATVRAFYDWAVDEDLRTEDPARRLKSVPVASMEPRPGDDEDPYRALIAAATHPLYFAWLVMILCLGNRCCEIAWARTEHFERMRDGGARWYCHGKRSKVRLVLVTPGVFVELEPHLRTAPVRRPLFVNPHIGGAAFTPAQVSGRLRDFLRASRVRTNPHQFRHRFATDYSDFDSSPYRQARVLGHTNPQQSMGYTATKATETPMRQVAARRLADVPRPPLRLIRHSGG